MLFPVHEKIVYPGHGVARVEGIIEKIISNTTCSFYELSFLNKDATILVPTDKAEVVGLRLLSSVENIDNALEVIAQPARRLHHYEFSASSWNKRNKQYQLKLRRGGLLDLSEIYRDLRFIATQKELSFGEKKLLDKAESLLVEEIALVQKRDESNTMERLRQLCAEKNCKQS